MNRILLWVLTLIVPIVLFGGEKTTPNSDKAEKKIPILDNSPSDTSYFPTKINFIH